MGALIAIVCIIVGFAGLGLIATTLYALTREMD